MVNATATQTELIVLIEQSKKRLEEKRRSLREHSVHHDENDGVNADSSESSQSHFYEKAIRTSYDTLKKRDLNSYSSTPLFFRGREDTNMRIALIESIMRSIGRANCIQVGHMEA